MFKSLRILHTIDNINVNSGGSRKFAVELCAAQAAFGATMHLVSQTRSHRRIDKYSRAFERVQTHFAPLTLDSARWRVVYSHLFSPKVTDLCLREHIQIIHDHGLWLPCNHAAAKVASQFKIPLVLHTHGMLQPWELSHRKWKKRIAWWLYQRRDLEKVSLFVVTSDTEAESIRRAGLRQPICILPIGVALPIWQDKTTRVSAVRYALFLSRIHEKKGLTNLVNAWQLTRPLHWRIIVAGPDEENHLKTVKMAVIKAGLQEDFEFVGIVEGAAKDQLYRKADLFILPTLSENFGIVIAEALSYGMPVITTHEAPWSSLLNYKCGWWVPVGVSTLVEAIREATSISDHKRYEMGKRGRKLVETEFSWPEIASKMLRAYEWILGRGDKPSYIY